MAIISYNFPLILEFTHHLVRAQVLRKTTIDFQFIIFGSWDIPRLYVTIDWCICLSCQFDEYEAWEVFVANVQKLKSRYYGIHRAVRRRKKSSLLISLLGKCNSLLTYWPTDVELMGCQEVLIFVMHDLTEKHYQHTRLHCPR